VTKRIRKKIFESWMHVPMVLHDLSLVIALDCKKKKKLLTIRLIKKLLGDTAFSVSTTMTVTFLNFSHAKMATLTSCDCRNIIFKTLLLNPSLSYSPTEQEGAS
jgi:hypothetical protein